LDPVSGGFGIPIGDSVYRSYRWVFLGVAAPWLVACVFPDWESGVHRIPMLKHGARSSQGSPTLREGRDALRYDRDEGLGGEPTVETVGSHPFRRTLGDGRGGVVRRGQIEVGARGFGRGSALSRGWVRFMFSTSDHRFLGRPARGARGDGLGPGGWLGGHCPGHASTAAEAPLA
jgi:hypothetical protein